MKKMEKLKIKVIDSYSTLNIRNNRKALLLITAALIVVPTIVATAIYAGNKKNENTFAAAPLAPTPTQPAGFFYNTDPSAAWEKPGALVICGRDNCGNDAFKRVSRAGGTVLLYLDTIVNEPLGKYHTMFLKASACGGAVNTWPGSGVFNNSNGKIRLVNDVRVGGVAQQKLPCVLESIVSENPHIGGFFADDLGGDNGNTQAGLPKDEYYNAAVALSKTFRSVADKHGLMFIPNGGWEGGHNAGYPTRGLSGNALADGSCVEHHSAGELSYWTSYLRSTQWAQQSALTHGTPFHIIITENVDFSAYKNSNFNGFIANQHDYSGAGTPWGSFHSSGLPNTLNGTTPVPSPTPTPSPSPTPSPTPTPSPSPAPNPTPTSPPTSTQKPYGGSARLIPGKIEAEDYDEGGQNVAYYDTDTGNNGKQYRTNDVDVESSQEGGYSIGWSNPGEWLEYTASATAGTYNIDLRVASAVAGSKLTLKYDNQVLKSVDVPNTGGWYTWKTVSVPNVTLPQGASNILRIETTSGSVNINYFNFTKVASTSPVSGLPNNQWAAWTPKESAGGKAITQPMTKSQTGRLLMQFEPSKTYLGSQDTQYCISRPAGSAQPKSITFTATYNAKTGNTTYFYSGDYFSKLWQVGDTGGLNVTKTITVPLTTATSYCFGNVALVGPVTISYVGARFLNVTNYTFNY